MLFLGTTFCSGKNSLLSSPTPKYEVNELTLHEGEYKHLYLSSSYDTTSEVLNETEWNDNTLLHTNFTNGRFDAGNTGFSLSLTEYIAIRRREKGENNWNTIFIKEVNSVDDFEFTYRDTYNRADTTYEYCISSFLNGVENCYIIKDVDSMFAGYYIADKDSIYGTQYNVDGCNTTRNVNVQTLELINSQYYHTASNSILNCDSGYISGVFFKMDQDGNELDRNASLRYRNDLKNRLATHKPLILKNDDGRIWLIRVSGSPTDSHGGHRDVREINFEWVEIGDCNDMKTMYNAGLTSVDSRWW